PGTKTDNAVTLTGKSFPFDRRGQWLLAPTRYVLKEGPDKFEMPDNFRDLRCTKVTVRHEVKVRLNFVRKVGAQILGHGMAHTFALNLCLFVIRFLVGQVLRSRVKRSEEHTSELQSR